MMDDARKRLADRFRQAGDVVPLGKPKKPHGPTLSIHGRKYVLSDWSSMGGAIEEMATPEGAGGGARLIVGPGNRFRYLWVFDTDRKIVAMWRHNDGDEKYHSSESSSMHEIFSLEKRGQLNRVTHAEFMKVEAVMKRLADDQLKALKEWSAQNQSDLEKQAGAILDDWFAKNVRPSLERRLSDIEKGVLPLGFKVRPEILEHRSEKKQARQWLITKALEGFDQAAAYKVVSKAVGYDAYDPPGDADPQAVQWAYGDFIERVYNSLD